MMEFRSSVAFSNVEIIELPYTLGDNPCVSSGVPIAASWEAQKRTTFNVDFFERYRPQRRTKLELHIPKEARKQLMLQAGFTPKQICKASRDAAIVRKGRFDTLNQLKARLQELTATLDPTRYGLPGDAPSDQHTKRRQRKHRQLRQPKALLKPKPSPISPKRKRSDRIKDPPYFEPPVHYDHTTTKRLRSPIQPTRHHNNHHYHHPCSPSYIPARQRMIQRLPIRPLMPPQRILSPPKIPYQSIGVHRPL